MMHMHMRTACAAAVVATVLSLGIASAQPPTPPTPYTTTMLRTHHFVSAEFLSIYEQLSVKTDVKTGALMKAYHIFPGFPFSMVGIPGRWQAL